MTLEELRRLMEWSTQECPNEWLTDDRWRSEAYDAVGALKHRLQHGFMRGFMSSAFTLWTRPVIILYQKCRFTNLIEFAGASNYSVFRHAILQKVASGQPLITFLTLKLNS
jgi:hypothetical protein